MIQLPKEKEHENSFLLSLLVILIVMWSVSEPFSCVGLDTNLNFIHASSQLLEKENGR